jgi:hypothetical protein
MKSAAAEATAAATASQRVIGNQGCTNEHNSCQNDESITKHDISLLTIGVPASLPPGSTWNWGHADVDQRFRAKRVERK